MLSSHVLFGTLHTSATRSPFLFATLAFFVGAGWTYSTTFAPLFLSLAVHSHLCPIAQSGHAVFKPVRAGELVPERNYATQRASCPRQPSEEMEKTHTGKVFKMARSSRSGAGRVSRRLQQTSLQVVDVVFSSSCHTCP